MKRNSYEEITRCKNCGRPVKGFSYCEYCRLRMMLDLDTFDFDDDYGDVICDDCECAQCRHQHRCPIMNS